MLLGLVGLQVAFIKLESFHFVTNRRVEAEVNFGVPVREDLTFLAIN